MARHFKHHILAALVFASVLALSYHDATLQPSKAEAAPPLIEARADGSIYVNGPAVLSVQLLDCGGVLNDRIDVDSPIDKRLVECGLLPADQDKPIGLFTNAEVKLALRTPSAHPGQDPKDLNRTYYTGPAARNPDGKVHAKLVVEEAYEIVVLWEDLYNYSTTNWDDVVMVLWAQPATVPGTINGLFSGEPWSGNNFLDSLDLPWCSGEKEPRSLTRTFASHYSDSEGFALDFGHANRGAYVYGTRVTAPVGGRAIWGYDAGGYGYHVEIVPGNGWKIVLAHLKAQSPLAGKGSVDVNRGDVVGFLDSSGTATGPHIHVALVPNGIPYDRSDLGNRVTNVYGHPKADFSSTGGSFLTTNSCATSGPKTVVKTSYWMMPGDQVAAAFQVDPIEGLPQTLRATASVPASDIDLTLTDPFGNSIGPGDPGVVKTGNYVMIFLDNASAGLWEYEVRANDVDPGGEQVDVEIVTGQGSLADITPPVTQASLTGDAGKRGWFVSPVNVELEATDSESGVAATWYRVDQDAFQAFSSPFVVGEGWHTLEFYSEDNAGNVEPTQSIRINVDLTPPTVDINEGMLDGLHWDQVHLERGVLTNTDTLAETGDASDNLCLWEVRAVDRDSGNTLVSQQPPGPNQPDWPPPYPANSLAYGFDVPLHTGINNIDVVAEDCAGWEKSIFIQVVYVIPGPYDPRTKGFWSEAVKTGKYTPAEMDTLLSYINVVSDTWGPAVRNIYGPLTTGNYQVILNYSATDMEQMQKAQLLANWFNLVSGRAAVLTDVDMTKVKGWSQVVDNTAGSPMTFALNVPMEIEEVDQTRLATRAVYQIAKNLAEGFNLRKIIP